MRASWDENVLVALPGVRRLLPVLSPIPPRDLFETLRELGFDVIDETSTGWLLADASDPTSEPILVPKHGDEVTPDVMGSLQGRSQRVGRAVLDAIRRYQERQLAPTRHPPRPRATLPP